MCCYRGFDSSECSVTRQYTPISPPGEEGSFAVLIKVSIQYTVHTVCRSIIVHYLHVRSVSVPLHVQLYKDGRMSEVIRAWAVGTVTEWKGPFGELSYKPNMVQYVQQPVIAVFNYCIIQFC